MNAVKIPNDVTVRRFTSMDRVRSPAEEVTHPSLLRCSTSSLLAQNSADDQASATCCPGGFMPAGAPRPSLIMRTSLK